MRKLKQTLFFLLIALWSNNIYSQKSTITTTSYVIGDCEYSLVPSGIVNEYYTAGSFTFQISTVGSNCSWTVELFGEDWLSASPSSGTGNATVTINYQQNAGAARTATIRVETLNATIYLHQDEGVGYDPDPEDPDFPRPCPTYTPQKSIPLPVPIDDENCFIQNGVIEARDYVQLKGTFSYSAATYAPLTIKANADLICDADYLSSPIVSDSRDVATTGAEVGSLPGAASVSSTGAATYNIPIEIPQGTAGMQPNLSITYSSQQGRSLLGKGFNISGLSAVTRVSKDLYHDSGISGLGVVDGLDRYSLDGNRLLLTEGYYGHVDSEYKTEQNNFVEIIYKLGDYGKYFSVETKDGKILEYGNSVDSRGLIPGNTTPLSFFLNKVSDKNGNCMTYTYSQEDGELWVKNIDYTGNVGLTPYNSINFYYDEREDVKSYYLSGDEIKQQKLLREIVVKTNDKVLRKYNLKYIKDDLKESCLNEIVESNGAGEEYNSTIIRWGGQNLYNIENRYISVPTNSYAEYDEQYYFSGDINGDGISDLFCYSDIQVIGSPLSYIKIYTSESDENGYITFNPNPISYSFGPLYEGFLDEYTSRYGGAFGADIFGSGINDVIVPIFMSDGDINTVRLQIVSRNKAGGQINEHIVYLEDNEAPLMTIADFDKNGRANIVLLEDKEVDGYYPCKILEVYGEVFDQGDLESFNVSETSLNFSLTSKPKAIFTGDYNNDGLIDLRVACQDRIYTYKNINGTINQSNVFQTLNSGVKCFYTRQGDFNGDGVLDLIIVGDNVDQTAIAYGNGDMGATMIYFSDIIGVEDPDTEKDDDEDNVIVTDFNNDGLSDFILFNGKYHWEHDLVSDWKEFTEYNVRWYKSTGTDFVLEKTLTSTDHGDAQKERYVSGDFNGDGRSDLINYGFDCYWGNSTTDWRSYSSFNDNFEANKVTSIHNGFNHRTEFKYRPLSHATKDGNDFYIKGTSSITDVNKYQFPLYVVDVLTQPDGKDGTINTNYSYEGLRVHNKGKGMLGFEKVTSFNDKTLMTSTSFNELDPTYFVVKKQTSEVYNSSQDLISKNVTDFDIKTFTENPKLIFNHPDLSTSENRLTGVTNIKDYLTFDDYGNVLTLTEHYKRGTVADDDATIDLLNEYTSDGRWLSKSTVISVYDDEPADTKISNFTYDTNGNLKTSISSGVTVTNNTFDTYGNVLSQTISGINVESTTASSTYDATGRFVKTSTNILDQTSTFDYNELGQLISETGVDGLTASYVYDNWGKLKSIKSPLGITTSYSTDWLTDGFYTLEQTPDFPDLKTNYDIYGRKVRTATTGFGGLMYSDVVYNDKGQVEKSVSPYFAGTGYNSQHETTYIYDEYGRTTSATNNGLINSTEYLLENNVYSIKETFPSGDTKTSYLDATGKAYQIENLGVSLDYNYHSNGQLKDVSGAGSQIDLTYDDNGNRDELTDPDAGLYDFDHDVYGRLESKTSPIGTYSATFLDGRLETETEGGNIISYSYVESGNGINQIDIISDNDGEFQNFDYDEFGRISDMTERVGDLSMAASYTYDDLGRSSEINYPEGFGIKYSYDNNSGELVEIRTNSGDLIWKLNEVNEHGQITRYEYGNGLETVLGYDANKFLSSITAGTIQSLTYNFDTENLILLDRTGLIDGLTENFKYDALYQLDSVVTNNKPELNLTMTYSGNVSGRMETKSDIGIFDYTSSRPHAITSIDVTNTIYAPADHDTINYTSFGKVEYIKQGDTKVEFTYSPDHQRKMMKVFQNDILQRKVYYFGNYERHEEESNIKHLYYIYSANGLSAIYKKETAADTMFYVHKDHLGSIQAITDKDKNVLARYYYNAWGVKSNIDVATGTDVQPINNLPWLHRGFTGHEHITEFGYINMNGRVYDADLGMFLSPDPYVQAPDNPVNFNRYAYCLNNPLVYTDPSGNSSSLYLVGGFTILGSINNLIQGVDNPLETAYNDANDIVEGFSNMSNDLFQKEIYTSDNTAITAGLDPMGMGLSANFYHKDGNATYNLSAGWGMMSGPFVSGGINYSTDGWSFSAGAGIGSNYKGWNASVTCEGYGAGYGRTYYGDAIGPDGLSNKQTTGTANIYFNHNSFRLENDRLGDKNDRWRSNAFELTIGNFSVGSYLYNNDPESEVKGNRDDYIDFSGDYSHTDNKGRIHGRWKNGQTYGSPLYFGYGNGNHSGRIGLSNGKFQHAAQNWFAHEKGFARLGLGGYQSYYMEYDHFNKGIYFGNANPHTLFNGTIF